MSTRKRFGQLVQAFRLDDRVQMEVLMAGGVHPDAEPCSDDGETLLVLAVRHERREVAALLLDAGASPDRATSTGETARTLAVRSRDAELARLFTLDPPATAATARLWKAIERAAAAAHDPVAALGVEPLLAGADLDLRRGGRTPLVALAASQVRGARMYAALISEGADAAATDASGATALHLLAAAGLVEEVLAIVDASPLDARDGEGRTPLHRAVLACSPTIVTLLLDRGAGHVADATGRTPLDSATGHAREALLDRRGLSVLGDLEIALRERWTRAELEVHADQLQADGDPRGELLALDLRPAPRSGKWRERRLAVLDAWLGPGVGARVQGLVRFGCIPHLHDRGGASYSSKSGRTRLAVELLGSAAGRYVQRFAVSGTAARVLAALHRLASAPRPWLVDSAIAISGVAPPTHGPLGAALIAATPSLRSLCIVGPTPFAAFPHPAVRRCVATEAITGLAVPVVTPTVVDGPDLGMLLEAIEATPELAALRAEYAELFPELDARLDALAAAALVDLDADEGSATLTGFGRLTLDERDRPWRRLFFADRPIRPRG